MSAAGPVPRKEVRRSAQRTVLVDIARSDPLARRRFEVDVEEPAVVLDLLFAIQRHEPSLAFRYSCRVAMCGTCGLRVDGESALACQTRVPAADAAVRLEPLAGLPVVRDLVVDQGPFWRAWKRAEAWFVGREEGDSVTLSEGHPARQDVEQWLDCIACGACWSACDLARADGDFVGPAALTRALVLVADPRDGARERRLRTVSSSGGIAHCHYLHGCAAACPKGLDPAAAIRKLRRWSVGVHA